MNVEERNNLLVVFKTALQAAKQLGVNNINRAAFQCFMNMANSRAGNVQFNDHEIKYYLSELNQFGDKLKQNSPTSTQRPLNGQANYF